MTPATYIYKRTEVATLGPDNENLSKVKCRTCSTERVINYLETHRYSTKECLYKLLVAVHIPVRVTAELNLIRF